MNLYICHTAYQVLVDLLRAGRAPDGPHTMVLSTAVADAPALAARLDATGAVRTVLVDETRWPGTVTGPLAALRARRESQAAQINAACTRLAQLRDQIDRTAALADIRVDQALSQANQSLARYGKACYFQALERELPRVVRSFCAGQSVNQDLRAEMDRLLKEDRR